MLFFVVVRKQILIWDSNYLLLGQIQIILWITLQYLGLLTKTNVYQLKQKNSILYDILI